MTKSPDAFRTISEVAEWLGIQAHVLRFWESKFRQVKPVKRAGGRRYYRPADMQLIGGIKKLLHDDGMTIKGVQKILKEQGVEHVAAQSQPLDDIASPPDFAAESGAKVLHFRGKAAPEPETGDLFEDDAAGPETEADAEPEPETATAPAETSEPEVAAEAEPEPELAPMAEPEAVAAARPEPDSQAAKPALPSFLQRRAEATPADPEAAELRARAIDIPEPAAEADQPYAPGTLARLARIDRLDAEQARRIAPVAAELRGWLERHRSAHMA
jgi:DNA-binding transcriptional MerR regulator